MSGPCYLENRYQDSGWEKMEGENYWHVQNAVDRASELARDAICYGMVRVVDIYSREVIVTFPAGGGKSRRGPTSSADPELSTLSEPPDPPEVVPPVFWGPGRVFMTLNGIMIPQTLLAIGIYLLGNPTWLDDGLWALAVQTIWVCVGCLVVGSWALAEVTASPSGAFDAWIETMTLIFSFYAWPVYLIALIRDRLVLGKRSSRGKAKVADPEI